MLNIKFITLTSLFLLLACGKTENWADLESYAAKLQSNLDAYESSISIQFPQSHLINVGYFTDDLGLDWSEYRATITIKIDDETLLEDAVPTFPDDPSGKVLIELRCKRTGTTTVDELSITLIEEETGDKRTATRKKPITVTCT